MSKVIKYILHIPSGLTHAVEMEINNNELNDALDLARFQENSSSYGTVYKFGDFSAYLYRCACSSGMIIKAGDETVAFVSEEFEVLNTENKAGVIW